MSRSARKYSTSGIYHVMLRGNGLQLIFEDDIDRFYFLKKLRKYKAEYSCEVLAYCLMENHVHLLLSDSNGNMSEFMHRLAGRYAAYFNDKHERVGHLFQDRFKSEVIESEEYLCTCFKYILMNPVKAGQGPANKYAWSSYSEYINFPVNTDTQAMLELLGGISGFLAFMNQNQESPAIVMDVSLSDKSSENDIIQIARSVSGYNELHQIASLPKLERDNLLRRKKEAGLTIRQIERLTGISKSVVSRVISNT